MILKKKSPMIKITYIWHDCFVISLEDFTMVFDFWKDPTALPGTIPSFINDMDKSKPLYVFVSHHHKDHYSKYIFKWEELFNKIVYIISEDTANHIRHILNNNSIYKGVKPKNENVIILKNGEEYVDRFFSTKAYGSTDIGNSYFITVNSKKEHTFFHAGDLNAWLWKDISTPEEITEASDKFKVILDDISKEHNTINYVMFPVDSRIGTDYFEGARLFVRTIDVKHFFPMHFCLGEDEKERKQLITDAAKVENYANKERGEYICLQSPYSVFLKN